MGGVAFVTVHDGSGDAAIVRQCLVSFQRPIDLVNGFPQRASTHLGVYSRSNILNALSQYRRTLKPSDNLLLHYAGHGQFDKDVDKAYRLPVDADPDSSLRRRQ
jgi:hypothetical protein